MFRITRGMHVQHVNFPLPIFDGDRDPLDETETPADRDAPAAEDTAAPTVAREDAPDDTGS